MRTSFGVAGGEFGRTGAVITLFDEGERAKNRLKSPRRHVI